MEWQRISRKGRSGKPILRWDAHSEEDREKTIKGSKISSIFFPEIPESCMAKDMFFFSSKKHGDFVEVIIPPKKNKFQKRFNFARFIEAEDPRMLAIRLDNIFISKKKMLVQKVKDEKTERKRKT